MRWRRFCSLTLLLVLLCSCSSEPKPWKPKYTTPYEPWEVGGDSISLYIPLEGYVYQCIPGLSTEESEHEHQPGEVFQAYAAAESEDWFCLFSWYEEAEDLVNIGKMDFQDCSSVVVYMMGKKLDMYLQRKQDCYPTNLTYDVSDHPNGGYATYTGTVSIASMDGNTQADWPYVGIAVLQDGHTAVCLFVDKTGGSNIDKLTTYSDACLNTVEVSGKHLLK